jgi:hypothetical protein
MPQVREVVDAAVERSREGFVEVARRSTRESDPAGISDRGIRDCGDLSDLRLKLERSRRPAGGFERHP